MLQNLPKAAAQPSQQFYPLSSLNLFDEVTRADYEAAGGPLVPFDPAWPEQRWWDDTVKPGDPDKSYTVVNPAGDGFATVTLPAARACRPNFKGLPNYLKWVVEPTTAVYPHAQGTTSPVDPDTLSTRAQAEELARELGLQTSAVSDRGSASLSVGGVQLVMPVQYPPDEARRIWQLVVPGGLVINVGLALKQKNASGVGSPGKWAGMQSFSSGIYWIADKIDDGSQSSGSPQPVPVRSLMANEKLTTMLVGGLGFKQTLVERTDLAPTPVATTVAGDAGYTGADRERDDETHRMVSSIYSQIFGSK